MVSAFSLQLHSRLKKKIILVRKGCKRLESHTFKFTAYMSLINCEALNCIYMNT